MKNIILTILLTLLSLNIFSQNFNNLKTQKPVIDFLAEYSILDVDFFKNGEGNLKNKNIVSYVLGFNASIPLSEKLNGVATIGLSEGFDYTFLVSSLSYKFSNNIDLFYGFGGYFIDDHRWVTNGLDGNTPSNLEFGMNFGVNLMLSKVITLTMKYNILEEKEDEINQSMSASGISFGLIFK